MEGFIRVNEHVINLERVLAIKHCEAVDEGMMRSAEHYLVVFDTQRELWLCPSDGVKLLELFPAALK